MFGRTLKASIAKDNGRTEEFIRKRVYPDKSRCFECGETGHLSYQCTRNALGVREPPPKTNKKKKKVARTSQGLPPDAQVDCDDGDGEGSEVEDPKLESLAAAIRYEVRYLFWLGSARDRPCHNCMFREFGIVCFIAGAYFRMKFMK